MFKRFAAYVLRSRHHAILMTLLLSVLPFLGWLGSVIVALVTLRRGAKEGFYVLLSAAVPGLLFWAVTGHIDLFLQQICFSAAIVWGFAILLRETRSWSVVLEVAALLACISIFIVYAVSPDINQYWVHLYTDHLSKLKDMNIVSFNDADFQAAIPTIARMSTGMRATMIMLSGFVTLGFARWMQAALYNPGGLRKELYAMRLSFISVLALVTISILTFFNVTGSFSAFVILAAIFILSGILNVHRYLNKKQKSRIYFVLFYSLFVLLTPYVIGGLIIAAIADIYLRGKQDGSYSTRKNA